MLTKISQSAMVCCRDKRGDPSTPTSDEASMPTATTSPCEAKYLTGNATELTTSKRFPALCVELDRTRQALQLHARDHRTKISLGGLQAAEVISVAERSGALTRVPHCVRYRQFSRPPRALVNRASWRHGHRAQFVIISSQHCVLSLTSGEHLSLPCELDELNLNVHTRQAGDHLLALDLELTPTAHLRVRLHLEELLLGLITLGAFELIAWNREHDTFVIRPAR